MNDRHRQVLRNRQARKRLETHAEKAGWDPSDLVEWLDAHTPGWSDRGWLVDVIKPRNREPLAALVAAVNEELPDTSRVAVGEIEASQRDTQRDPVEIVCVVCGESVMVADPRTLYCDKEQCQRRRVARWHRGVLLEDTTRECKWGPCGRSFTPSHPRQVYCSPEHSRLQYNANRRALYRESGGSG